jgi:acyl carrier protein
MSAATWGASHDGRGPFGGIDLDTQDRIKRYVAENLLFADGSGLDVSASLLESGVLDSTGALDLVAFLEREFGIRVADEDLVPENLDTIERLAQFVDRKRSRSGAPGAGS